MVAGDRAAIVHRKTGDRAAVLVEQFSLELAALLDMNIDGQAAPTWVARTRDGFTDGLASRRRHQGPQPIKLPGRTAERGVEWQCGFLDATDQFAADLNLGLQPAIVYLAVNALGAGVIDVHPIAHDDGVMHLPDHTAAVISERRVR